MNRETEQRFAEVPYIDKPRSKFKRPYTHKTTFNTGELIPIYLDQDILPGDTVSINMSMVVRMATPLYPVLDNAYMDVYFFFVPDRLIWEHWREFWGENNNPWYQTIEYEIPQIITTENTSTQFKPKTLADYFGLPMGKGNLSVSHLPFRAYCKCFNDWFRDENLQQNAQYFTGDSTVTAYEYNAYQGGYPLKANRFHDYFSSALPAPQKGNEVYLPLGTYAPIITRTELVETNKQAGEPHIMKDTLRFGTYGNWLNGNKTIRARYVDDTLNAEGYIDNGETNVTRSNPSPIFPNNLWADLGTATAATITQLRQAFAIQRFYEAQARGGSRYIEFLKNIFGVTSPDARLQRSEYLGGKRIPINMETVLQTSSTDTTSPQGNTGAFSHTADVDEYFTKSFTEHGILLGLACVRTDHSYEQGIERGWSRKKFTDFYLPQFAHLSEMAILNKELYAQGTSADEEAFGYQEAWADYRYKPNSITGAFRSSYPQSLNAWHYGDYYTQQPILGPDWIKEPKTNVDRTLAVTSELENQFLADFYFDCTYVRPMPLYSVPGLLDHF